MTKEELQDSIELLCKFIEMLKEAVDNQDYAKAWEVASASRYRVGEISKDIEDKWYDKMRQTTKKVKGEGNETV